MSALEEHVRTDMHGQQLQVEEEMFLEAKLRQQRDNSKAVKRQAWSESKIGRTYTSQATSKFVYTVSDKLRSYSPEFGKSHARAIKLMAESGLEAEVIAHLFSKTLYNLIPLTHRKRLRKTTLCVKVGDTIHDEMRIRFFAENKNRRNLLKKLFDQFDKRTYPRHWRKRTILNYFHSEQLSWSVWSTEQKAMVGEALLIWFIEQVGLVSISDTGGYVDPSPHLMQHVQDTLLSRILEFILYKPMLVPPRPWASDNLFSGGYLLKDKVKPYPLVKGTNKKDKDRLEARDWSRIIPAVNAIQETPWRVNTRVLEVLDWCMKVRGGDMAGLPAMDDKPLPPKPPGYGVDEEITKEHDKVCFLIHSENREVISKRLMILATSAIANAYKEEQAIYFPHNLDSRGRAYPVPVFLNPQGPDSTKALLEFYNGEEITCEEHANWLAIAGANAYGNDKVSLLERVDWVKQNEEMIVSVARDPYHDLRWTQASEPFQFLRFCFEWADFKAHGFGFVSYMVIPVDATCSGLQHYSAMLRDEIGGRSVNLVPGLPRQDIYQDVADVVIDELMDIAQKFDHRDNDIAVGWIKFGINRKTTKRQVMVVPYSGTFASCMAYTREAVLEKIKDGHPCPWDYMDSKEHSRRIVLLSQLIWGAIDKVVVKGKLAMQWLSKAAQEYTKWANKNLTGPAHTKCMHWFTPDGFEVVHYRVDQKKKRIWTYLDGATRTMQINVDLDSLSSKDMALAVAPNFVHSMDACLLRASIMNGLDEGITDYGMVHDSFGVHATKMTTFLTKCVKPAFIEMYQRDVLEEFRAKLPPDLDLPALPTKGSLVLENVTDSEFFFS